MGVRLPAGPSPIISARPSDLLQTPLLFSAHYRLVERLAEMIIPEDDTPGAKQAGVAEFIDFMVANRVPVSASRDIRFDRRRHGELERKRKTDFSPDLTG